MQEPKWATLAIGHFMKSYEIGLFPYTLCYSIEGLLYLYHGSVILGFSGFWGSMSPNVPFYEIMRNISFTDCIFRVCQNTSFDTPFGVISSLGISVICGSK